MERQQGGWGDHLQAKESSLGGNQLCWSWLNPTSILEFLASETVKNESAVLAIQLVVVCHGSPSNSRDRRLNLGISENRVQDKDLGAGSLIGSDPRKQELGCRECEAGVLLKGV